MDVWVRGSGRAVSVKKTPRAAPRCTSTRGLSRARARDARRRPPSPPPPSGSIRSDRTLPSLPARGGTADQSVARYCIRRPLSLSFLYLRESPALRSCPTPPTSAPVGSPIRRSHPRVRPTRHHPPTPTSLHWRPSMAPGSRADARSHPGGGGGGRSGSSRGMGTGCGGGPGGGWPAGAWGGTAPAIFRCRGRAIVGNALCTRRTAHGSGGNKGRRVH